MVLELHQHQIILLFWLGIAFLGNGDNAISIIARLIIERSMLMFGFFRVSAMMMDHRYLRHREEFQIVMKKSAL